MDCSAREASTESPEGQTRYSSRRLNARPPAARRLVERPTSASPAAPSSLPRSRGTRCPGSSSISMAQTGSLRGRRRSRPAGSWFGCLRPLCEPSDLHVFSPFGLIVRSARSRSAFATLCPEIPLTTSRSASRKPSWRAAHLGFDQLDRQILLLAANQPGDAVPGDRGAVHGDPSGYRSRIAAFTSGAQCGGGAAAADGAGDVAGAERSGRCRRQYA